MNYLWLIVLLPLGTSIGFAQNSLPPKKGYRVTASHTILTLTRGHQDSVKISIARSKSFKTGKPALSFNAPREAGLIISTKQLPDHPDDFMVYLNAPADAKVGEYNFATTCSLQNKNKGIVLKLIIQ